MKHIRYILSMILVGTILLCGCSSKKDSLSDTGSQKDSELSSIISSDDELIKKSDGTVTMGFKPSDNYEYTYSGDELEVPLYVGTNDNSEEVEVAAILFLNGEVQPYYYKLNDEVSEKKLVHYFNLKT